MQQNGTVQANISLPFFETAYRFCVICEQVAMSRNPKDRVEIFSGAYFAPEKILDS